MVAKIIQIQLRAFTEYKAFSTLQSLPGSAFSGGISQDGIFLRKYLEHISDICKGRILPKFGDILVHNSRTRNAFRMQFSAIVDIIIL